MARAHPIATVVIEATDQQRGGFRPRGRVIVALVVELGLHRVKKITIEDGGLLAGEVLALEGDLADVEPIAQKMGKRTASEWDPSDRAPALERSHLGDDRSGSGLRRRRQAPAFRIRAATSPASPISPRS
jgi:hypothetical protein